MSRATVRQSERRHHVESFGAAIYSEGRIVETRLVLVPGTYSDDTGREVGRGVILAAAADPSTPILLLDLVGARTLLDELLRHVPVGSPS